MVGRFFYQDLQNNFFNIQEHYRFLDDKILKILLKLVYQYEQLVIIDNSYSLTEYVETKMHQ